MLEKKALKRILLTGSSGFIGSAVCKNLVSEGYQVAAVLRQKGAASNKNGISIVQIDDINKETDWRNALRDVQIVVHLAARAHILNETCTNALECFRRVNVGGTEKLAYDAARAGVKRFVYISSIKVNGAGSPKTYKANDAPMPEDDYGMSKWEGEKRLRAVSAKFGMESVIIRPPLVYGPGVKANFLSLMNLVDKKIPLPFANIKNRRSLIYIDNLVDAIRNCMIHPAAAGQTYLVSDGKDVSTPELVRLIAASMNANAVLFPFPQILLSTISRIFGKAEIIKRLSGSLTVDISKINKEMCWVPPFSMEYGLLKTAQWYRQKQQLFKLRR